MFTTTANNLQGPTAIQYQTTPAPGTQSGTIIKGVVTKMDKTGGGGQPGQQQQQTEFPTFCYTNGTNTVNLAQLTTTDDNKTCYIQPFPYNGYVLANQFQNGIASIATMDGMRIQVKQPIANTVSSISFKCDVCGAMFTQLGQLNQHKRIHSQEEGLDNAGAQTTVSGSVGQGTITVVTSGGGNFIQGQNLISETGQSLGQIQIVQPESLDQSQQHHQDVTLIGAGLHQATQQQQPTVVHVTVKEPTPGSKTGQKCYQCGGPRRKGGKGGRCENCIKTEQQQRATQLFVDPSGEVKFEITEMEQDMVEEVATSGDLRIAEDDQEDASPVHQSTSASSTAVRNKQFHPVKKRNSTVVSKCNRCNGTGVIYVEANGAATNCNSNVSHDQTTSNAVASGATNQKSSSSSKKEKLNNSQSGDFDSNMGAPSIADGIKGEKPFYCNICGGQFSRYSSLWSHRKLHTGEKNHKCVVCGLAFAKSVYLKNHMRIHTGEKPYRCGTCGMQFSQSPHLKNHERTHSGEKPYVCEVCDKGFARHATLWNHRRIHTGEKPYKCEICGSAFSQAAHLKNHAKVHSGEKPFKCDICGTAFADRFALKRHRGIHDKYGQTQPRSVPKDEIVIDEEDELMQHM